VWLYENIFSKDTLLSQGTFIEIGALDGEKYSNTWYFEQKWDWRGLLIEGLPSNQPALRDTPRKNVAVFTAGVCGANPGYLTFTKTGGPVGATQEYSDPDFIKHFHGRKDAATVKAACAPLQLMLDATGLLDIDLFSLDVEGAELAVLETIDWESTNIHVILVEMDSSNATKNQAVRDLLALRGFQDAKPAHGPISDACLPGRDCTANEVYINPAFKARRRPERPRLVFGTGLPCPH
jgi:FkbM family methyltransferase